MRFIILACLLAAPLTAQQPATPPTPAPPQRPTPPPPTLRPPVQDNGIFSPLPLPPANDLRRVDGAPGKGYWQQRADYSIKATLDTAAKALSGREIIQYTNNSPDTLRYVWLQLDQNLFRPGSTGSLLNAQESRYGGAGFHGGFEMDKIAQTGLAPRSATNTLSALAEKTARPVKTRVDDTMMYVELATAIPPGQTSRFVISYHFNIPEHGADRMGRDGALYELAQWYPRMAVYDDVNGWNTLQYLGQGEFYLEYGDIAYEVTVPAGYIVAGTGTLVNTAEVLTVEQRSRLARASSSDTTIHVITAAELSSGAARPKAGGTMTWRFSAQNVRDVAWAASPEYLWDASGWNGILTNAYYRPSAAEVWKDAAEMTRYSIREYSTRWYQYQYPQITAVEGPVSGMEYPMVAMEARSNDRADLYWVVTHEVGHMWFPMMVGSDERRYAWMDEGLNTFINIYSDSSYLNAGGDAAERRNEPAFVIQNDQTPEAQPIMTFANRFRNTSNLGSLAYNKPSLGLYTLRNKILGPDVFDVAFREYVRRWVFKHPQPADFFRTMSSVTGRDLDWFWRGWFYTTAALDQSVDAVRQNTDGGKTDALILLRNLGGQVMPVELELTLTDGSTRLLKFPVEIWYRGDRYVADVTLPAPIKMARVNPDGQFPDAVPGNNAWNASSGPH